jgi:nucleoside-diphosphate-sugar epimerase
MATNVAGTKNVLEAAVAQNVGRFVFISSITVHGSRLPEHVDENTPFVKTGRGYSDSKVEAEELIRNYRENYRLPVVIIRPTYVWGPRSGQFTIGPVLSMKNGTLRLIDDGIAPCPAVYVDNLVDALLLAGANQDAAGETFIITDGQETTWRNLISAYAKMIGTGIPASVSSGSCYVKWASRLAEILDRALVRWSPNPAPLWRKVFRRSARILRAQIAKRGIPTEWYLTLYSNRGRISIEKARRLLGYAPRFTLASGMAATEAWLKDQVGTQLGFPDQWPVAFAQRGLDGRQGRSCGATANE